MTWFNRRVLLTLALGSVVSWLVVAPALAKPGRAKPKGKLAVGDIAPTSGVLRDLRGRVVDLALLCGPEARRYNPSRPQALLIDLYMTTCVPCNAGLPVLGALAKKLQPQGVRTLLVSLDGTEHAGPGGVTAAALKEKVAPAMLTEADILRDPGQVLAEDFGIVTREPGQGAKVEVPRTLLLDGDCKVRGSYTSIEQAQEEIERLVTEIQGKAPEAAVAGAKSEK